MSKSNLAFKVCRALIYNKVWKPVRLYSVVVITRDSDDSISRDPGSSPGKAYTFCGRIHS